MTIIKERPEKNHKFNLLSYVESARCLLNLHELVRYVLDASTTSENLLMQGLVFGSDDFCADIGNDV